MCSKTNRVIFHVDVNSAFLSWEAARRVRCGESGEDLRQQESAVGGDMSQRRGIILAKSIPAKRRGVKTGESIPEALGKCPGLILVPPDYELYRRCSRAFLRILGEYTPVVEPYSIDEAFMDMSGTSLLWGRPVETAEKIRQRIWDELGFTVNIGISTNKLLAKMASDFEKPNRVHTLFPEEIREKMWPLPVGALFSVGRATEKQLHLLGINTIGELANANPVFLRKHLKKLGETVWAYANGMDASPVQEVQEENKGYGNSTTIAYDVQDGKAAGTVLLALCEMVGARMREAGVQAQMLSVGIKTCDWNYAAHQMILPVPTAVTGELYQYALSLFRQLWNGRAIRQLGVQAGKVCRGGCVRQLSLFDRSDYFREAKADAAVDAIRKRYGRDAVKRAVFVGNPQMERLLHGLFSARL